MTVTTALEIILCFGMGMVFSLVFGGWHRGERERWDLAQRHELRKRARYIREHAGEIHLLVDFAGDGQFRPAVLADLPAHLAIEQTLRLLLVDGAVLDDNGVKAIHEHPRGIS